LPLIIDKLEPIEYRPRVSLQFFTWLIEEGFGFLLKNNEQIV